MRAVSETPITDWMNEDCPNSCTLCPDCVQRLQAIEAEMATLRAAVRGPRSMGRKRTRSQKP